MEELVYTKTTNGWRVFDKNGNAASGLTKEMARNQYLALYTLNKATNSVDISKFNSGITNANGL